MSYRIVGHSPDGHRVLIDEGPNTAKLRARGGLALGQALTAVDGVADVRPVGAAAEAVGLRGEALLRQRRKR